MIPILNQPEKAPPTVWDLLRDLQVVIERMGRTNPHRQLLLTCGAVILELTKQLNAAKGMPPPLEPVDEPKPHPATHRGPRIVQ